MRNIFDEVTEAKTVSRRDPTKPGIYVLDVKSMDWGEKEQGKQLTCEFIVAEAKQKDPAIAPTAVGSVVSSLACFYGNGLKSAPGSMKKIVCAVLGEGPDEVDKADFRKTLDALFSPDGLKKQPCRGRRVYAQTNAKEYPDGVKYFLNLEAAPESVNAPDAVAKRRAAIEANEAEE